MEEKQTELLAYSITPEEKNIIQLALQDKINYYQAEVQSLNARLKPFEKLLREALSAQSRLSH